MTGKLYYEDAYLSEFEAGVEEVRITDEGLLIRLDATAFYPEGGGQPADTGRILLEDGTVLIITDVQEEEGDVWHKAAFSDKQDIPSVGSQVTGMIDWDRRFDHMQQHSGEHIVSGMICSEFNCDNVGFHMGEDTVTIDYNTRISYEQALEIERRANAYIWQDHEFKAWWPSEDELASIDHRSKKELDGNVRITSFPGADTCACCGVHVSTSSQVGLVKFISAKNFHEGTRLELLCGRRAYEYLSMNHRANKSTAVLLSTSEENTPEYVQKLIDENIRIKSEYAALEEQYLKLRAETFEGEDDVYVIEEGISPEQGRKLADLIADKISGTVTVFVKNGSGYRYSIISRSKDISGMVKDINQALNGRGGGRGGFAQGSVSVRRKDIEEFFKNK